MLSPVGLPVAESCSTGEKESYPLSTNKILGIALITLSIASSCFLLQTGQPVAGCALAIYGISLGKVFFNRNVESWNDLFDLFSKELPSFIKAGMIAAYPALAMSFLAITAPVAFSSTQAPVIHNYYGYVPEAAVVVNS